VDLGPALSSAPAKRRPVVIVQADAINRTAVATVTVATVTSRVSAAAFPWNVLLPRRATGLPRDSVLRGNEILTLAVDELGDKIGKLPSALQAQVDDAIRMALEL
jgi:mRNA interferase MazF